MRQFYLLLIPVTIGLMLLHHGGDWIRKLIRLRFGKPAPIRRTPAPAGHGEMRMLPFERVQHAVLAISFLVLVWTGFALKYPDQWWARPLLHHGRQPLGAQHRSIASPRLSSWPSP